ncbi:MAG: hypothetical protein LBU21_00955, partial [Treponema sp.]|nr:hypothetical protein [Treponema sp.]
MLKKSLLLSIAVLLTAVIFIFTGCEGPAGPAGQNAENGDINFPDSITVSVPSGGGGGTTELPPSLPPGVTYPEKGAKILSGNAADISKAFNGGVFVANTPDSGTLGGSNTGGETYAQDAVDAVVWTGVGDSLGASYQGSIVVPPGKTLFIAAPLTIDSGSLFQGITIADEAAYTQSAPYNPSILQATKGGTSIEEGAPGGKVIILNGGSITGSGGGGPLTIGGYLEIHRGGSISVGVATLSSTYGSV